MQPSPTAADYLGLSAAVDLAERAWLAADGRRDGFEAGHAAGYVQAIAEVKAAEHQLVHLVRDGAKTETARWRLRGEHRTRATFGQPHKDDYPGRDGGA